MSEGVLKLRSGIISSLKRFVLLRGTCIAFIGITVILSCGVFLPPATLRFWGLPAFFFGLAMIAWGLLPYRRLSRLEMNPYELIMENDISLKFLSKGNVLFTIPTASIEELKFIDGQTRYGIAVQLKQPLPEKIKVYDPKFNMEAFQRRSKKRFGCDLFLPYFTHRSFETLQETLN